MQLRVSEHSWHRTLWKIVTNPATEVVVAMVVVLLAAWVVVQTDVEQRSVRLPLVYEFK